MAFGHGVQANERPLLYRWLTDIHLLVRVGDDFISNYDVAVDVVIHRQLQNNDKSTSPDLEETLDALARILGRKIVLDAARMSGGVVPNRTQMSELEAAVLAGYDNVAAFEAATGIEAAKFHDDIRQRVLAAGYVRKVMLANVKSAPLAFGAATTEPSARLQEFQTLLQLKTDILRLRQRFLERNPIEILSNEITLEQILAAEDAFASM